MDAGFAGRSAIPTRTRIIITVEVMTTIDDPLPPSAGESEPAHAASQSTLATRMGRHPLRDDTAPIAAHQQPPPNTLATANVPGLARTTHRQAPFNIFTTGSTPLGTTDVIRMSHEALRAPLAHAVASGLTSRPTTLQAYQTAPHPPRSALPAAAAQNRPANALPLSPAEIIRLTQQAIRDNLAGRTVAPGSASADISDLTQQALNISIVSDAVPKDDDDGDDGDDDGDDDDGDDAPTPVKLQRSDFEIVRTVGTGTFARVCLVHPSPTMPPGALPGLGPQDPEQGAQPDLPELRPSQANSPRFEIQNHAQEGQNEAPRALYALKILRKASLVRLKQVAHVREERRILKDIAGFPFVTNLLATFSDRDTVYMVLDYVPGGEMFTYLRRLRRFDEPTTRFYAAEIVLVLEFLHEQQDGVAYRDLKPENLLLDSDGHIRLVDFGFAKRLAMSRGEDGRMRREEAYTLCGTPEYLAPELILNAGHTTAVDWWALGVLIFEFLTGYPPYWASNPVYIYRLILEKEIQFPASPAVSAEAMDIVFALCTRNPSRRLGNTQGGASLVKAHPFFNGVDWDALYNRSVPGPLTPPLRFHGDTQCFDQYSEQDNSPEPYTPAMAELWDNHFADF